MKTLEVRKIGWLDHLPGDDSSPESFALPSCVTALAEYLGGDVRAETIRAHDRTWTKRRMIDDVQAACGISFGLLWADPPCPSCTDLTQVHEDHDDTIRYAFEVIGYACDIAQRTDDNRDELRARIVASIDAGMPVLAFGIVGPPECAIVCGYDDGGDALLGWSHFQSYAPEDCAENGMFKATNWHADLWKVVFVGAKAEPRCDVREIATRGLAILRADRLSGYAAGDAAYDGWIAYVSDPAIEGMDDEALRGYHQLHHMLVGNHAEARCYLGDFLRARAAGDAGLLAAAQCFADIHDTCWKVWGVLGGIDGSGWAGMRDAAKRAELTRLIADMRELDRAGAKAIAGWLEAGA